MSKRPRKEDNDDINPYKQPRIENTNITIDRRKRAREVDDNDIIESLSNLEINEYPLSKKTLGDIGLTKPNTEQLRQLRVNYFSDKFLSNQNAGRKSKNRKYITRKTSRKNKTRKNKTRNGNKNKKIKRTH
jgi:hypothetical protein